MGAEAEAVGVVGFWQLASSGNNKEWRRVVQAQTMSASGFRWCLFLGSEAKRFVCGSLFGRCSCVGRIWFSWLSRGDSGRAQQGRASRSEAAQTRMAGRGQPGGGGAVSSVFRCPMLICARKMVAKVDRGREGGWDGELRCKQQVRNASG